MEIQEEAVREKDKKQKVFEETLQPVLLSLASMYQTFQTARCFWCVSDLPTYQNDGEHLEKNALEAPKLLREFYQGKPSCISFTSSSSTSLSNPSSPIYEKFPVEFWEKTYQVETDSRRCTSRSVFLALRGQKMNGHNYVKEAWKQACRIFVLEERQAVEDVQALAKEVKEDSYAIFWVRSTLEALGHLAKLAHEQIALPLVAITGSVGKTSVRSWMQAGLSSCLAVHSTQANLNNEIGVPQTILSCPPTKDLLLVEMGMDKPGDLAYLSPLAKPRYACISSVGASHVGAFENLEHLAEEKAAIRLGLPEDGLLLLQGRCPALRQLSFLREESSSYGTSSSPLPSYLTSAPSHQTAMVYRADLPLPPHFTKTYPKVYLFKTEDRAMLERIEPSCLKLLLEEKLEKLYLAFPEYTETEAHIKTSKEKEARLHAPHQNYVFAVLSKRKERGKKEGYPKAEQLAPLQCKVLGLFSLPLFGQHQVDNALFTLAVAEEMELPFSKVVEGLQKVEIQGNRQKLQVVNYKEKSQALYLLNDAYNASLQSFEALLKVLPYLCKAYAIKRCIFVIGGIVEMGEQEEEIHEHLGHLLGSSLMDKIFLLGETQRFIMKGLQTFPKEYVYLYASEEKEELLQDLVKEAQPGDLFVFKASHAYGFEALCESFREKLAET